MNLNNCKIDPLWTKEDQPGFLDRTETVYSKISLHEFKNRGIENRLFDSLIKGLPDGCIISGGFMVNFLLEEKNAKDIDIFCTSEQSFKDVCNLLLSPPEKTVDQQQDENPIWAYYGYTLDSKTDLEGFMVNNKEVRFLKFNHERRPSIQIMKMAWYTDAYHVIDTFDLTCVQVAADKNGIYLNPLTQLDLAKKRLVLHRMQFPASTVRRIIKYASKGFYACPGSLVNITNHIQSYSGKMDIDEEQFVYLD